MNEKLSVAQVLQQAWVLYRHKLKIIFLIAFILGIIREILTISLPLVNVEQGSVSVPLTVTTVVFLVVVMLLSVLASALILGLLNQKDNSLKLAINLVFHRLWHLVIAGIVFSFLFAWGLRLFIIPGALVATLFYFYQPLILFRQQRALPALISSVSFVKANFFMVLGLVFLSLVLTIMPNLLIFSLSQGMLKNLVGVDRALTIFVNAFIIPYTLCLVQVAYWRIVEAR